MSRRNQKPLDERVATAAAEVLAATRQVSPAEVLTRIGWLYPGALDEWRQRRIECLEDVIQVDQARLLQALKLLVAWASAQGLMPVETQYLSREPQPKRLHVTRNGNAAIEEPFRIHWVSGDMPERQRERVSEQASRAPELVVISPLNRDWTCHRCGGQDDLLVMEKEGPACLKCVGLDDLDYLPSGDALVSRRAKARSGRHAVVVRFSRTRKRYERQGLLVEAQVLREVRRELGREAE